MNSIIKIISNYKKLAITLMNCNRLHAWWSTQSRLATFLTSDSEAIFLGLHLSISNDIISTKIYDKRNDLNFEIVNFPF